MADKALRIRAVVVGAPIAFLLEISGNLRVTLPALLFGNSVLVAPPTFVAVMARVLRGRLRRLAGPWWRSTRMSTPKNK